MQDLMGGSLLIGQRRHLSMCYPALRCTRFLVNLSATNLPIQWAKTFWRKLDIG